jgi:hypothetical protein
MPTKHTFLYRGNTLKTKTLGYSKAIREKCMECSNWSPVEVSKCSAEDCALYPFRFGKDPGRKKVEMSDERRRELSEQLKRGRENR